MEFFIALFHLANLLFTGILRLVGRKRAVSIVFDCPHCKEPRLAKLREHPTYDQNMHLLANERSLTCQSCFKSYNAESFHPDSAGVYQLKTWDCPDCKTLNPNTTFICNSCGFRLV